MYRQRSSNPTVWMTREVRDMLELYILSTAGEISGLGKAVITQGDILITDIYLLRQKCSPTFTELDKEDVNKFLYDMLEHDEDPSEIKLWWHSHASMDVFWSPTDDGTAEGFGNGWMLSLVSNKHGDYLARLDMYEPFKVTIDNLLVRTLPTGNTRFRKAIEDEISEKVSKYVPPPIAKGRRYPPMTMNEAGEWVPQNQLALPEGEVPFDWEGM